MPRKTDGIEFEIHPRPTKGEDGDSSSSHERRGRQAIALRAPSQGQEEDGGRYGAVLYQIQGPVEGRVYSSVRNGP